MRPALPHADAPCRAALLTPHARPAQELHERRITFMEGSAVSGQDLVTARAERARACLLLADRFTTDPEQEDLSILFQVRAPSRAAGAACRRPPALQCHSSACCVFAPRLPAQHLRLDASAFDRHLLCVTLSGVGQQELHQNIVAIMLAAHLPPITAPLS